MTEATLIYRETVTLTVPQDVAWVLITLLLMGVLSVVHTAVEWKDEIRHTVAMWWHRRGSRD